MAIVAPERLAEVEAVSDRWELHRAVIGEVTETGELRALWHGETRRRDPGALPHRRLPALRRRARRRGSRRPSCRSRSSRRRALPARPDRLGRAPLARVRHRRYDQLVQSRTVRRPGLDAAVLRLRPSYRGLAVSLDGTGRIASLDPFTGGARAILEAARNVACAGGEPLGFTDCLNFGNPEKPRDRRGSSRRRSRGWRRRVRRSALPIVSGNVSLYNDTNGRSIHPDARRRLCRPRRRRAARSARLARGRRDRPRHGRHAGAAPDRSTRRATARSPACRRPSTSPPRPRSSGSFRRSLRAVRSRTTSPTAGSRSRWPRLPSAFGCRCRARSPDRPGDPLR